MCHPGSPAHLESGATNNPVALVPSALSQQRTWASTWIPTTAPRCLPGHFSGPLLTLGPFQGHNSSKTNKLLCLFVFFVLYFIAFALFRAGHTHTCMHTHMHAHTHIHAYPNTCMHSLHQEKYCMCVCVYMLQNGYHITYILAMTMIMTK